MMDLVAIYHHAGIAPTVVGGDPGPKIRSLFLPESLFARARWTDTAFEVEFMSGERFVLPGDDREIFTKLFEDHFGQPIAEKSVETFTQVAGELTPVMLSMISNRLARAKRPRTPAYYTDMIKRVQKRIASGSGGGGRAHDDRGFRVRQGSGLWYPRNSDMCNTGL